MLERLERRLGRLHARQRLGIEADHEAHILGRGLKLVHFENWYSIHSLIGSCLRASGLYWRGRRNAERVEVRHNIVRSALLPHEFDGFTLLHLTDLHVEISERAMQRVAQLADGLSYDACVLTGDYRNRTFGSFDAALAGLAILRRHLKEPIYGVLGNHDSIRMVPALEDMGIRMLLNEADTLARSDARIHIAGVDDAHFFRMDNLEKAAALLPQDDFSILLSHTPEIYRQAAHAGFDLMLSGHTHGGQICLPGGIPVILEARMPRRFGAGAWQYKGMQGYTSVGAGTCIVPVRLNCPPEITLHRLERSDG